ncbi:MAG: B12-binding domain-containing protein, partial [Fibrobacterota bacterium]
MLHYAAEAGLDAAIFNPLHRDNPAVYDKEVRELGEDLLFNRRSDALERYVDFFEKEQAGEKKPAQSGEKKISPEEKLRLSVLNRDRRNLGEVIRNLLENHSPHHILNSVLLPAMSEVGERMASG